jgi:hypothetical protein
MGLQALASAAAGALHRRVNRAAMVNRASGDERRLTGVT